MNYDNYDESDGMYDEEVPAHPYCWSCGNKLEMITDDHYTEKVWFKCTSCMDEYNNLLSQYEKVNGLYESLQSHLKCLIS